MRVRVGVKSSATLVALAAVLALLSFGGAVAQADGSCTDSWKTAVSGDWSTPSNWTSGVPTTSAVACIDLPGTYTVTISGKGVGAGSLELGVGAGSGTQTLEVEGTNSGDAALDLDNNPNTSTIAPTGVLALTVTCSGANCSSAGLEDPAGTIDNQGTIESNSGSDSGSSPRQLDAAVVNTGTVAVNAPLQYSGSHAEFDNNAAGRVTNNGGSGALVLGPQSSFHQAAGTTSPSTANAAHPAVVLDDTFNTGPPTLRYTGTGASTIEVQQSANLSGNIASSQHLIIDGASGCPGQSLATSSGGFVNAGTILLTGACDSGLKLTSGTLTNHGTLTTAPTANNVTREINGNLTNSGTLNIDGGTVFDGSGATLQQSAGTTTIAHQTLDLTGSNGDFELQGGLLQATGTSILDGSLSNSGGNVFVGTNTAAGHMSLDGNYTQGTGGQLTVVINGTSIGSGYSQLSTSGPSSIAGKLIIKTLSGPKSGNLYTILGGGNVSGKFSAVTGMFVPAGATPPTAGYKLNYQSTTVNLDAQAIFRLTVKTAGPGTGTVTRSPSGMKCGSACTAAYFSSQKVTLTEHPGSGWVFNGWSGGCTGRAATCSVTMSQSRTVTASFAHGTTTKLTSSRNPSGKGKKVTYTAAVSPHPNGGTVKFTSGGRTISGCGSVALSTGTGKATCSVTYKTTGTRKIQAAYSGNSSYARSASSTLTETIKKL